MKVHYRHTTGDKVAPCGYVFLKHLRGLDCIDTWNPKAATPVNCLNCLMHRPVKRKIATWDVGGKTR